MSTVDRRNQEASKLPKVHNVHIIDASGSMIGGKYDSAITGVNDEQAKLKTETEIMYTQTVVEFDRREANTEIHLGLNGFTRNSLRLTQHYFMVPIADCNVIKGRGAEGSTPLYQTVGEVLEGLEKAVPFDDKCVVTIFTDGEENSSEGRYKDPRVLNRLIKRLQKNRGFTITFMGTQVEVNKIVKEIGIRRSNTLAHENTEDSISSSYCLRSNRFDKYSRKLAAGASEEELMEGFFEDIKKDEE